MRDKITLIFKSGTVYEFRAEKFTVKYSGGDIVAVEWRNTKPRAVHIDPRELAAVFSS